MNFWNLKDKTEKTPKFAFFLLLAIISLVFLPFVINQRIAAGHDGLQTFSLQYFFLNSAAIHKEIPLWIPYLTHGTLALWWIIIQGLPSFLVGALTLLKPLAPLFNPLQIFHLGFFINQLFFITGAWLLGRRFSLSPWARFLTCICLWAPCIYEIQPHYSLNIIYALPLIIEFLFRFFVRKNYFYLFLAINLFCCQTVGNIAYFIPLLSFTIFLFWLFFYITHPKIFQTLCRDLLPPKTKDYLWITLSVLSLGLTISLLFLAKSSQTVISAISKNPDGTVPVEFFLLYGNTPLAFWKDLICAFPLKLDWTIYMGFFPIFLIPFAFLHPNKKTLRLFLLCFLFLLAFSAGSIISLAAYYCWPLMKYLRHISLSMHLSRFFLCFLCGLGFDALLMHSRKRAKTLLLALCGAFFIILLPRFITISWEHHLPSMIKNNIAPSLLASRLSSRIVFCYMTGFCLIFYSASRSLNLKFQNIFLMLLLIVFCLDAISYNFSERIARTIPTSRQERDSLTFTKMIYRKRRNCLLWKDHTNRRWAVNKAIGCVYNTVFALTLEDHFAPLFRVDSWQKPLDDYYRAYAGIPLTKFLANKPFYGQKTKRFSLTLPESALRMSGLWNDKIRFFRNPVFASDDLIAAILKNPNYTGNVLLLSKTSADQKTFIPKASDNRSELLDYTVKHYSPNSITINVNTENRSGIYLFYSDIWHPSWKVYVDGKPQKLEKANLAYKAVRIPDGKKQTTVKFVFESPLEKSLISIIFFNCALWIIGLMYLMTSIFRKKGPDTHSIY